MLQRCERCGEWIDRDSLVCPRCRGPLLSIVPFARRGRGRIAFGIVLTTLTIAAWLFVRSLIG